MPLNDSKMLKWFSPCCAIQQAVIDGPTTGVARQPYSFKRLVLTNLVVKSLPRNAGSKIVKEYVEKNNIVAAWEKTAWAQKLKTREVRANLTDFERFKLRKLKAQVRPARLQYYQHMY